jgi:3',5'-cyclic AMP phosphodiesterase CpdA
MRRIVHLSDLHFGRVDPALLGPLRERVIALSPHLVVVSGDLTQRAKSWQFREAKAFLDTLPQPQLVVPGNHDVPLYNVFQRFFTPLRRYRRYMTRDLEPAYLDEEIAVVGINTARSLTFKDGRINDVQVEKVRQRLCHLHDRIAKIIVTHHPFDVPEGVDTGHMVDRADMAMRAFIACGADVLLSGHLHKSHTSHSAERYKIPGHSALIVQAGTATSTRGRGEANSFNALQLDGDDIVIERYTWQPEPLQFALSDTQRYVHAADGWHRPRIAE